MYDGHSKGISYGAGFFMLIAFAVAGAILAQIIYAPIWTSMTGDDLKALTEGRIGPEDTNAVRMVQSISAIVGFLLPTIVTAFILHRRPFKLLGFDSNVKAGETMLVIVLMILAIGVSSSLSYFNQQIPIPASWKAFFDKLELDYNRMVEVIIRMKDFKDYLIALVVMAFLPALCEETLFRGGFQNFLTRATRNPWLSIIIVGLIFSLVHLSFYGFLSRLFLGIVLGWIYHYSGKLWLSIIAHFLNNALLLTYLYLMSKYGEPVSKEPDLTFWGILFLPLLIFAFLYFRKISAYSPDKRIEA